MPHKFSRVRQAVTRRSALKCERRRCGCCYGTDQRLRVLSSSFATLRDFRLEEDFSRPLPFFLFFFPLSFLEIDASIAFALSSSLSAISMDYEIIEFSLRELEMLIEFRCVISLSFPLLSNYNFTITLFSRVDVFLIKFVAEMTSIFRSDAGYCK